MNYLRALRSPCLRDTAVRSVIFRRVCHPRPCRLKYSITSRSSLIVVCTLTGAFCGPRPRGLGNCKFGKIFDARLARRIMVFVHCGLSGSVRFFIEDPFFPACLSQTDHADASSANCKSERVQALFDNSKCQPSRLAVVQAVIGHNQSRRPVEIQGGIEADAMLAPVGSRFGRVPFIHHFILLLQFTSGNIPRIGEMRKISAYGRLLR
jgi:hypothetical protein